MSDPRLLLSLKDQEISTLKLRIQQEQEIVAHVQISQVLLPCSDIPGSATMFRYPGYYNHVQNPRYSFHVQISQVILPCSHISGNRNMFRYYWYSYHVHISLVLVTCSDIISFHTMFTYPWYSYHVHMSNIMFRYPRYSYHLRYARYSYYVHISLKLVTVSDIQCTCTTFRYRWHSYHVQMSQVLVPCSNNPGIRNMFICQVLVPFDIPCADLLLCQIPR